jgi:hypothetical protein
MLTGIKTFVKRCRDFIRKRLGMKCRKAGVTP